MGQPLCHPPGVELKVDVSSDHSQEAEVWGAPEPLVLEMAPMSKAKGSLGWGVGNVQEPTCGHGSRWTGYRWLQRRGIRPSKVRARFPGKRSKVKALETYRLSRSLGRSVGV